MITIRNEIRMAYDDLEELSIELGNVKSKYEALEESYRHLMSLLYDLEGPAYENKCYDDSKENDVYMAVTAIDAAYLKRKLYLMATGYELTESEKDMWTNLKKRVASKSLESTKEES